MPRFCLTRSGVRSYRALRAAQPKGLPQQAAPRRRSYYLYNQKVYNQGTA